MLSIFTSHRQGRLLHQVITIDDSISADRALRLIRRGSTLHWSRRGIRHVVATDNNSRAIACARENLQRLQVSATVVETDLFPPGRADLVVCNPPWIPATPITLLDQAVYDEDGRMLRAFLGTVRDHVEPGGEVWLILSDLAERLGLRERVELLDMFRAGGLRVAGRADVVPRHRRARKGETTSLWRLR